MTEYEKGYKDGMAGAALPNIIDNGDKIDGYAYSYKTDSEGVPYINIDSVRAMLTKAADVQPITHGKWIYVGSVRSWDEIKCSACNSAFSTEDRDLILNWDFCPHCGARMDGDTD